MTTFIKYEPIENESFLGIATVSYLGRLILRYKISPTKDGKSFFASAASYKMKRDGEDVYVPCFMIDSRIEEDEIREIVRSGVKEYLNIHSLF